MLTCWWCVGKMSVVLGMCRPRVWKVTNDVERFIFLDAQLDIHFEKHLSTYPQTLARCIELGAQSWNQNHLSLLKILAVLLMIKYMIFSTWYWFIRMVPLSLRWEDEVWFWKDGLKAFSLFEDCLFLYPFCSNVQRFLECVSVSKYLTGNYHAQFITRQRGWSSLHHRKVIFFSYCRCW